MSKLEVQHAWKEEQWDWPLQHHEGVVKVIHTKEKFEVTLDMPFFTPKEIDIKLADGHKLVIMCLHEERSDTHGTIKREVNRCYHLPADVDTSTLKSNLSANGHLHITAGIKK